MSATKLAIARALLLKAEASYNAGGTVTATADGFLLAEPTTPTITPIHDGARRGTAPAIDGNMRRVVPSAFEIAFPVTHEAKGAAAAYSASVFPSVHRALLGAGFDGAVTVTGGSERWDYTPTPLSGTPASLFGELYAREEKYPFTGAYLNLERIAAEDLGIPLFTFGVRGLLGTIADSAIPSVTYPTLTTEPPKATNIAFTLGSWTTTAVVRSWSLQMQRALGQRANQNASSGHAGFSPGRRNPVFECVVEAPALVTTPFHTSAGIDPYNFFAAATEVAAQVSIGATQYNRWKLILGRVQMSQSVQLEEDEGAALYRLTFQVNPTSMSLNDDVTLRWD